MGVDALAVDGSIGPTIGTSADQLGNEGTTPTTSDGGKRCWLGAAIAWIAAFAGATLESYLGATLERRMVIDNDVVNFANTLAGALIALVGTYIR